MTLRIAVVHEHQSDFVVSTELADRVLIAQHDWLVDYLAHSRHWISELEGKSLTWSGVKKSAKSLGIRAHGRFPDGPGKADAVAGRRAIEFLLKMDDTLDAIMLIRDQDDQPERRLGLEQARAEHGSPIIVIGFAIVEREAWVISGFEPQDPGEQARLDAERQTLGFYPHQHSHELTACKDNTAPRSPKRVLKVLTGGDTMRERRCWNETPLALLRERGTENGLFAFLEEVRIRLAPQIGHVPGMSEP
jgi:hypothetical protein